MSDKASGDILPRPAAVAEVEITTRLPAALLARVTSYAESEMLSRSDALRTLIEAGFAALESDDE
jgi:hypothetical protein